MLLVYVVNMHVPIICVLIYMSFYCCLVLRGFVWLLALCLLRQSLGLVQHAGALSRMSGLCLIRYSWGLACLVLGCVPTSIHPSSLSSRQQTIGNRQQAICNRPQIHITYNANDNWLTVSLSLYIYTYVWINHSNHYEHIYIYICIYLLHI